MRFYLLVSLLLLVATTVVISPTSLPAKDFDFTPGVGAKQLVIDSLIQLRRQLTIGKKPDIKAHWREAEKHWQNLFLYENTASTNRSYNLLQVGYQIYLQEYGPDELEKSINLAIELLSERSSDEFLK